VPQRPWHCNCASDINRSAGLWELRSHSPLLSHSPVMIIPDDLDTSSPLKGDDNRAQQPISPALLESSGPPPPPYTSYQATSPYVSAADFVEIEGPAGRRFVRAFLVAVSIWVLAGIFIFSAAELCRSAPWVSSIKRPSGALTRDHEYSEIKCCEGHPRNRRRGRQH